MEENVYGNMSIVKKSLNVYYVIDDSGSMAGEKIAAVNNVMKEIQPELAEIAKELDLKICPLVFSTGARWLYPQPVSPNEGHWSNLEGDGSTDMGAAFRELNDKVSRNKFQKAESVSLAPIFFLISDGQPTDKWESELAELWLNRWFQKGIRVGLAIGEDADAAMLEKFTGSMESVIRTEPSAEKIKKWIKQVTLTSTQIGTQSHGQKNGQIPLKQHMVAEALAASQSDEEETVFP